MRAYEFLVEAKYDYSLSDYEETPYDPGFEHYGDDRGVNNVYDEPHIGPQEGKYLNLMLKGIKPATIISSDAEKKLFEPYIKNGTVKVVAKDTAHNENWYLTLPGEEWRGRKLQQLFHKFWDMMDRSDTPREAEKKVEAQIGMLLGLPKESVRYFLKTRY